MAFAYLDLEDESFYLWILSCLKNIYDKLELRYSVAIATNGAYIFINACKRIFSLPVTKHLVCQWHVNKVVAQNYKKAFEINDDWEAFRQH